MSDQACVNTDRELWRGPDLGNGDFYADSIHVTKDGGIGINVGGRVIVKPLSEWHRLATEGQPVENAPRDGKSHLFKMAFRARAFWDDEDKRWVLTYPLRADYLPAHAKYLGPAPALPNGERS